MLILRLLGGASLEGEAGPLMGPAAQRHRLALLALLSISHPGGIGRDKLLAYLWPSRNTASARNLLNQSIHVLRKALGERAILSVGDELRLNPTALRVDALDFEEALAAGDPKRAVELYRGPFLDGFFLSDAAEFERRVEAERGRLRDGYRRALEGLAEAAEVRGDAAAVVQWWRALAAEDPYSSRVALELMRALERAGERGEAIRQAGVHGLLLEEELGAEPDPGVAALAERMRRGPVHGPGVGRPAGTGPGAEKPGGRPPAAKGGEGPPPEEFPRRTRRWTPSRVGAAAALALGSWAVIHTLLGDVADDGPEVGSVAVLPLANLTGDPEQDYFAEAMHDVLVAELSRIGDLTVRSRQSVLRYRESDQPLPVIGRELGVDALVEGAVFLAADSVRVTAQLVRASPEEHLWSDVFLGARGGALALQGEVAQAIARAVRARLAPEDSWLPAPSRTVDPRAQEAYLNGLYHLTRQALMLADATPDVLENVVTAIGHLEEAVGLEPEWATAHAKLALAYHWLASRSRSTHAEEFFPKARAAALRALELDENESQAHAVLGFVLYQHEWDWDGAERSFRRALDLDPNSHHHAYALFLQSAGRLDEAIVHFRRAEERDPLSERLKHQLAGALRCAGRYDEALVQLRELEVRLGRDPRPDQVAWVGHGVARAYAGKSMPAEAITELERAVALTDSVPLAVAGLAEMYAQAGRLDEARALLARLEERAGDRLGRPAQLLAALGETDRAVAMLEDAFRDPSQRGGLANFRCTESYRLLADEPRIQAIVRQIGYPN